MPTVTVEYRDCRTPGCNGKVAIIVGDQVFGGMEPTRCSNCMEAIRGSHGFTKREDLGRAVFFNGQVTWRDVKQVVEVITVTQEKKGKRKGK